MFSIQWPGQNVNDSILECFVTHTCAPAGIFYIIRKLRNILCTSGNYNISLSSLDFHNSICNVDKPDAVQMVKDRRDRRDSEGDPADMPGAMGVIAQQDEDIDTLLGIIDVLKAAGTTTDGAEGGCGNTQTDGDGEGAEGNADEGGDTAQDKKDRADSDNDFRELLYVVRVGDRLNMDGLEAMSVKDAKKAVLGKLKPTLHLDGKSAAYVNAAFDMAVSEMKERKDTNYQRSQMMHGDGKPPVKQTGSASEARQRMIDRRMKKEEK